MKKPTKNDWIAVTPSSQMPENFTAVIVRLKNPRVEVVGIYTFDEEFTIEINGEEKHHCDVTHWKYYE